MMAADTKWPIDFLRGGGEMGDRIRGLDWSRTPLGPIEGWPQSLKTSVSLILSSRHPMWIGWGPETTFLYNDAYLHVLGGAKHPQSLGRPASKVWAEIWDVCGPLADKVFQEGEASFVDDVRLFMDRGGFLEETFYSFSYSPIRDESGRVSGLFCPSTDVTPKVLNARRLRTLSELAANTLVEKTTTAACVTVAGTLAKNPDDVPFALFYLADEEGRRAWLEQGVGPFEALRAPSPKVVDLSGESGASPWPIAEVFRTAHRQIVGVEETNSVCAGAANQPVVRAVVLPVTSRGEQKPYGVMIAGVNPCRPLDADHLTFFELVAGQVATAIQNARSVEEEKRRADMLAEIDRAKTVFFSNVSHEFRTPLTLMLGPLETLLAKPGSLRPEDREQLVIAHRNSLRLLKLVNTLLDFSRIEAGRMKASYIPTDLAALTADLASNFRSVMQTAGLELVVDCPTLPQPVDVDREMWEKIVLNLLSNAFKFTFEGRVTVRVRAHGREAVLEVSDTGTGIPENELPRLFERFHRIEGAKSRTYEGTGIGLALIQELVKLNGGNISVTSRLGSGSTFTVALPFSTGHLPKERTLASAAYGTSAVRLEAFTSEALTWLPTPAAGSAVSSAVEAVTGVRQRVVVADDNADMRELVARILGHDYELVMAVDGQQALASIRRNPPDLLLTDVMMPRMDGFELLHAIRGDPATRTLPVIFLSARASEEMQVEGLEAGADDYLIKPFTASELRARVKTHIQLAAARQLATAREAALRAEAEAARDRVTQVLESITDAFMALDPEWRLTYVNAEAARVCGLTREQMLGQNHWDLFPDSIGTAIQREYLRAVRQQLAVDFENFYTPWQRWFHVKAYPAAGGGLSVFFEDVTHRKAAEEALRRSEERFRGVFESSAVGVAVIALDERFLQVNHAFCSITGYSENELRTLACAALIFPDDLAALRTLTRRLISGEIPAYVLESRYLTRDGRTIWVQNSVSVMRDAQGCPENLIALCEDFTARKNAERELSESEERFRAIVETTPESVKVVAPDGTIVHMNSAGLAMIGANRAEDVIGKSVYNLIVPEFRETYRRFNDSICGGNHGLLEFEITTLDGRRRQMETHAAPLGYGNGRLAHLAITLDVTERKRAEQATLLLSAIVDSSDDAIVSKDLTGIVTSWNRGAERLFGYSAEEMIGESITKIIPSDRLTEELDLLERLHGSGRLDHVETARRRKDGSLLDISLTISPIKDAQGNIIGASKIARDIGGRKRAEQAIQALNAQLTADLAAMTRMHELSTRLVQEDHFPVILDEILQAGMELTSAVMGNIQLVEDGALKIAAQRGFTKRLPDPRGGGDRGQAACGTALQRGERVIVEEVASGPVLAGSSGETVLSPGARTVVQSTPLVSRSGHVVGLFSTYYGSPGRPSDRELRLLDLLARQAADLIERKRAESALRASEKRFRQLADSMPQIVWTARPDGYVDYYNQRWYQFTGFKDDVFGDLSWDRILHSDDLPRAREVWYDAVRTGGPYACEQRFWDRNEHRWRWFIGRALPVRDEEGKIVKWFGTATDIDGQKRVEDELRRANQDLEQFAYSASHDLQEPLRSVKIYSELLTKRYASKLDGQALVFLDFLGRGATRMEMLVRDLLAYTQVTRLEDVDRASDASEALKETLANLSGAIAESGAGVTYDPLPALPVNGTHLNQLFQNLIANAIKYRSPDRVPRVHVSAARQDGHWLFSVSDNGIGIEAEYKEHIFGLFKRLHSGDEYSGTGIGLAICQRIVERYRGRIWVESKPGEGSRFIFTLPV